jgi:hypothetical protein
VAVIEGVLVFVFVLVTVFVGVILKSEVGDKLLVILTDEVGLLVEGGVPVGSGVTVTDLVAGLVGVRV